jgi:two-component system, NtrC family, sensor histidine kinase PilS
VEEKRRLTFFILARIVVVSLFLVSTAILRINEPESIGEWSFSSVQHLIIVTYLFSLVTLAVLRFSNRFLLSLAYLQIIWDLLFVTVLLLLTGGIGSPFSFLYLLSIVSSSVLLARREAIYTASLCGILYGAILDFQFYGMLAPLGLTQAVAHQYGASYIFYTIFVNIVAFYLTAFLTGYLSERARRSEQALEKKEIDYEELSRLQSAIVAGMNSGLITVTPEGNVRVFNDYAQQLTGYTLEEAYDRPVGEIVPELADISLRASARGEIEIHSMTPDLRIFSYSVNPLPDAQGDCSGRIINFQDVTILKRMEERLKHADRLAAIGELSARMAHEIRNPLASISGSVQLIGQCANIERSDRKLLEIVVRETDRLNALITDFLAYARPQPPNKVRVFLREILLDVRSLAVSDPGFGKVEITIGCPENLLVQVDVDQMKQVMWNLLVNAADAIQVEGTIVLSAGTFMCADVILPGECVRITVSDTGAGMARDEIRHVFEPFFTTKPQGTGLGLATVYRIIAAHGGSISVESEKGLGTTFTIYLENSMNPTIVSEMRA